MLYKVLKVVQLKNVFFLFFQELLARWLFKCIYSLYSLNPDTILHFRLLFD